MDEDEEEGKDKWETGNREGIQTSCVRHLVP